MTCENCGGPLTRRHQRRFCSPACAGTQHRGRGNTNYNGGLCFDKGKGRWVICCRDGSLMLYYRGVMAAELGRLLRADEIVHHRNHDSADDRLENLEIVTRAEHMRMHHAEIMAGRGLAA